MERIKSDFEKYNTLDLLEAVISLSKGDNWDGMSSKKNDREYYAAFEVLKEKISSSRIEKLETSLTNLISAIPGETEDKDWWPDSLKNAINAAKSLL